MILRSIELESFRNLQAQSLSLPPRGAVLQAPNGRGKTNFLEALHYLTLFRSFRGAPDAELATFGHRAFTLRGEVVRGDAHAADAEGHGEGPARVRGVGVSLEGARKRVAVDGRVVRPVEHIGDVLSVILSPVDIRLVQGSPARRRRYLDVLLSLCSRRYLRGLQEYRRVLKQRNRVLQTGRGASQLALLEPWTEQLVRQGALLIVARLRFFTSWAPRLGEISERLAGGPAGRVTWRYASSVLTQKDERAPADGPDPLRADGAPALDDHSDDRHPLGTADDWAAGAETPLQLVRGARSAVETERDSSLELPEDPLAPRVALAEPGAGAETMVETRADADELTADAEIYGRALRHELERVSWVERRRGVTLAGPHRDDFSVQVPAGPGLERDLRSFGSQGEQRTAALALRLLEAEVLACERGELPVILLDDVFSELDPARSEQLLEFVTRGQQVFLTTPKPLPLTLPVELSRYEIAGGEVRPR